MLTHFFPPTLTPGENMFLLALNERAGSDGKDNHAIIRYLVDLYGPRLLLTPHQKRLELLDRPTLYDGKSPLHQAILAHDVKLIQFFIERGANVHARCTGSFFSSTSHAYYGEFPLSFAVCTGQKEVARYLVESGALVNEDHDVHCCYALHMAVMSDRIACAWGGKRERALRSVGGWWGRHVGSNRFCQQCVGREEGEGPPVGRPVAPTRCACRLVVHSASFLPFRTINSPHIAIPQCTTSWSTSSARTPPSSTSAAKRCVRVCLPLGLHPMSISRCSVRSLCVDELDADPTLLEIRGETVRPGSTGPRLC